MVLLAKRVSAPRCAAKSTSTSRTPNDWAARWTLSKSSRLLSIDKTGDSKASAGISGSNLYIVETRRACSMTGPDHLFRLALAAVRHSPQHPMIAIGDGGAGIPELGGDAAIGGIFQHACAFAIANLPGDLATELKVVAFIVDRPATIGLHINGAAHAAQNFVERLLARLQADIGHPDERQAG